MTRSKSSKPDEDLRGRLRELEKLNKALKRRLRSLEKNKHLWQENNLDEQELEIPEAKEIKCKSCFSGTLIITDLGIKILHTCSNCGYRKIIKK